MKAHGTPGTIAVLTLQDARKRLVLARMAEGVDDETIAAELMVTAEQARSIVRYAKQ